MKDREHKGFWKYIHNFVLKAMVQDLLYVSFRLAIYPQTSLYLKIDMLCGLRIDLFLPGSILGFPVVISSFYHIRLS